MNRLSVSLILLTVCLCLAEQQPESGNYIFECLKISGIIIDLDFKGEDRKEALLLETINIL